MLMEDICIDVTLSLLWSVAGRQFKPSAKKEKNLDGQEVSSSSLFTVAAFSFSA